MSAYRLAPNSDEERGRDDGEPGTVVLDVETSGGDTDPTPRAPGSLDLSLMLAANLAKDAGAPFERFMHQAMHAYLRVHPEVREHMEAMMIVADMERRRRAGTLAQS